MNIFKLELHSYQNLILSISDMGHFDDLMVKPGGVFSTSNNPDQQHLLPKHLTSSGPGGPGPHPARPEVPAGATLCKPHLQQQQQVCIPTHTFPKSSTDLQQKYYKLWHHFLTQLFTVWSNLNGFWIFWKRFGLNSRLAVCKTYFYLFSLIFSRRALQRVLVGS